MRLILSFLFTVLPIFADAGTEEIGKIKVVLYLGGDDLGEDAAVVAKKVDASQMKRLSAVKAFNFKNYYILGKDTASVLRSYENWASPLKPSEAILVSFETVGRPSGNSVKLDIDLWQNKKKIMKSAATELQVGKPLYIRGPKWKKGYLILEIEVTSLDK